MHTTVPDSIATRCQHQCWSPDVTIRGGPESRGGRGSCPVRSSVWGVVQVLGGYTVRANPSWIMVTWEHHLPAASLAGGKNNKNPALYQSVFIRTYGLTNMMRRYMPFKSSFGPVHLVTNKNIRLCKKYTNVTRGKLAA